MKLIFIILLFNQLLSLTLASPSSCQHDWQCPNNPYSFCRNKINVQNSGIGLNIVGDRIYFTGRYVGDDEKTGNSYLFSVPVNPDGSKYREEFQYQYENFTLGYEERFTSIQGYNLHDSYFMVATYRFKNQPRQGFYSFQGHQWNVIFEGGTYQRSYLDPIQNRLYRCELNELVSYVLSDDGSVDPSGREVKYNVYCEGLWMSGNNLYWTSRDRSNPFSISFHTGAKVLINQPNPPAAIGSNEEIYAFTGTSNSIIYSTKSGLYQTSLTQGSVAQLLVSEDWIETALQRDNNVYYTTSASVIKKINLTTKVVTILYDPNDPNPKSSQCKCKEGFTTNQCNQCAPGYQVIWVNGSPSCRPPGYCTASYQCNVPFNGNPYAYCYLYNQCSCSISYLTYPNCDKCPNGLTIRYDPNGYIFCGNSTSN